MPRYGLNFRATAGFVADGPGETYVLPTDAYPTTRGGYTFGWMDSFVPDAADRAATFGPRLAGSHLVANTGGHIFRFDCPPELAGSPAKVWLAVGDLGYTTEDNAGQRSRAFREEFTALLWGWNDAESLPAGTFKDTTGTRRSAAAWLAGAEAAVTEDVGSYIIVQFGVGSGYPGYTPVAHLALEPHTPGAVIDGTPVHAAGNALARAASAFYMMAGPLSARALARASAAAGALAVPACPAHAVARRPAGQLQASAELRNLPLHVRSCAACGSRLRVPVPDVGAAAAIIAEAGPHLSVAEATATITCGDTMLRGNTVRLSARFYVLGTTEPVDPDVVTFRAYGPDNEAMDGPVLLGDANRTGVGAYFVDYTLPDADAVTLEIAGEVDGFQHVARYTDRLTFA